MPPSEGATTGASAVIDAHAGELAAGPYPVIEIADDGARQHRRAGDAQGLQAAQGDQHFDRGREHAAQADRDVECSAASSTGLRPT